MNNRIVNYLSELTSKQSLNVVGVSSGTSMDGMDLALTKMEGEKVELLDYQVVPYQKEVRQMLLKSPNLSLQEVAELSRLVSENFYGALTSAFGDKEIDLIGFHGQTVYHHSMNRIKCSMQIGDSDYIAVSMKALVIGDFRQKDLALDGQGAPVLPYADKVLFNSAVLSKKNYKEPVALLNLGGIANFTILDNGNIFGYDIGPANAPLDRLVRIFTENKLSYDDGGNLAKAGSVDESLLRFLIDNDAFVNLKPPKSTGFEMYGDDFIQKILTFTDSKPMCFNDILRTLIEFIAWAVSENLRLFSHKPISTLIMCGGGSKNQFLVDVITSKLPELSVTTSEEFNIPSSAREAVGFAVLAYHALLGQSTSVPSVTGASREVVLGKFSFPI